ncbi:MAG: CRISPR-associated endonuclease Cas2 [bacterium]|nr:CRISPR-associated endonuclease Cas2 [bacterium]
MGKTEIEARGKRRRKQLRDVLLASIAVSGVVLVAAIAPNALAQLRHLPAMKRAQLRYRAKTTLGRLAMQGLIEFEKRDGKSYARITPAGRKVLALEEQKANLANKKKRRWDERWRVVAFDIPERRRKARDRLRAIMSELGFAKLQNSVWVYPYDCEDLVALLKADLKLGVAVLYMVVEHIENDKHLRDQFGLKQAL